MNLLPYYPACRVKWEHRVKMHHCYLWWCQCWAETKADYLVVIQNLSRRDYVFHTNQGLWHSVLWEPWDETVLNIDEKNILKDCTHNWSFTKKEGVWLEAKRSPRDCSKSLLISIKYLWCVQQFCWFSAQLDLSAIDVSRWIMQSAVWPVVIYFKCPWCGIC